MKTSMRKKSSRCRYVRSCRLKRRPPARRSCRSSTIPLRFSSRQLGHEVLDTHPVHHERSGDPRPVTHGWKIEVLTIVCDLVPHIGEGRWNEMQDVDAALHERSLFIVNI